MAHYAFLDSNNIVTEVIVGKNEGEDGIDWEQWYGEFRGQTCKRTSYSTLGGIHSNGGTPFRKNYAGFGYTYDLTLFKPTNVSKKTRGQLNKKHIDRIKNLYIDDVVLYNKNR